MASQDYQFVIVTCRPNQFFRLTKQQIMRHHVPFYKLFCVGGGGGTNERKLRVIRDEKIEVFVDNNKKIVEFMKRNLIKAVTTLNDIN